MDAGPQYILLAAGKMTPSLSPLLVVVVLVLGTLSDAAPREYRERERERVRVCVHGVWWKFPVCVCVFTLVWSHSLTQSFREHPNQNASIFRFSPLYQTIEIRFISSPITVRTKYIVFDTLYNAQQAQFHSFGRLQSLCWTN